MEAAPGDAVRRGGGRLVRRGRQGGGEKTDAGARGETKRRIRKRQTERRRRGRGGVREGVKEPEKDARHRLGERKTGPPTSLRAIVRGRRSVL